MKLSRIYVLAALPLAIAACAEEEPEPVMDEAVIAEPAVPAATDPAAMGAGTGMEQMVNMTALNNSGVTGQATVTPADGQTQVMVTLNAGAGGATHEGHIHQGTCDSPGGVVQPLQPITLDQSGSGSMTTTVQVEPNTVMDGQHIVLYHEAGGSSPVVCGSIPMHQM